jgi:acyl-CoA hydrolase
MFSNWRNLYDNKATTAHNAFARTLKNGSRIYIGSACGTPQHLVQALASCIRNYSDMEIIHSIALGESPFIQDELRAHCRVKTFFVTETLRRAVNEGLADYIPVYSSAAPNLFRRGELPLDFALVQVSPPDDHGFCSLGVAVDMGKAAAESARFVIAQVNPQMPRVLGDSFLHVSEVDAVVEHEEPRSRWESGAS